MTIGLLLASAATGCGAGDDGGATGTRPAAPGLPGVTYTFSGTGLTPAAAVVPAAPRVRLTVVAADGRPHGVVVRTPAGRVRLVVLPGATRSVVLRGLRPGARYRVVPDGAAAPVLLQVRR